ncbi:unnamed protein product [Ectocarpus sp. 13 AM-2016]
MGSDKESRRAGWIVVVMCGLVCAGRVGPSVQLRHGQKTENITRASVVSKRVRAEPPNGECEDRGRVWSGRYLEGLAPGKCMSSVENSVLPQCESAFDDVRSPEYSPPRAILSFVPDHPRQCRVTDQLAPQVAPNYIYICKPSARLSHAAIHGIIHVCISEHTNPPRVRQKAKRQLYEESRKPNVVTFE